MNKNTKTGLLALGLVAAAAWFRMSPEQKANVKNKIGDAGKRLKDNLPENLKNLPNDLKGTWAKKTNPVLEDQVINN